jgi:hypothetical protein
MNFWRLPGAVTGQQNPLVAWATRINGPGCIGPAYIIAGPGDVLDRGSYQSEAGHR